MKTPVILLFAFLPLSLTAQNVGIGTTTPLEKLEVRNPLRATLKVSSNDFSDTTELLLSNKISNITGTDFSLKHVREEGLFISSQSDWPANNSAQSLVIKPWGYVGLNDVNPVARLTVNGSETEFNGFNAAIALRNTASTNTWFIRAGGPGTGTPNGGLSIADNAAYHFLMDAGGNIGLGITPSGTKLHVNGGMKIQGTNILEFGAGVAGKEANAGKIGYNGFGTGALAIVGAGTSSANRAVYFFAEGGTTFNGAVNIQGPIQLSGNSGATGQVLTSSGSGDPVWRDVAYNNNTRFRVGISESASGTSGDLVLSAGSGYNLNPTDVTINPTSITINKTGLYHFDISMISFLNYSVAPAFYPRHELWCYFGTPSPMKPIYKVMDPSSSSGLSWQSNEKVSVEVHIVAPATLHFFHRIASASGGTISNFFIEGFITGHLIVE